MAPGATGARLAETVPAPVREALATLWRAGHAAYVVGGALRDVLAGREGHDWDLATSALPEQTTALFDGAVYENLFGTVAVRIAGDQLEITTFRSDHDYADFRRPHRVEFGSSIVADLARRDFTMNALAWGAEPATGGTSNPTNFVIFGKQRMVLRTKPSVQLSAAAYRINREYRLLTSLTGSAVPVLPRSSIATTRQ